MVVLVGSAVAVWAQPRPAPTAPVTPVVRPVVIPITKPLTRKGLQRALRKVYAGTVAKDGMFTIHVKEAGGAVIFSRKARTKLHPASCVKLVTSTAALRSLGAKHKFKTLLRGKISGATMTTPLYLWGDGDPSLSRDDLKQLAAAIKSKGVTAIPQGIVVDDSYFDGRRWAPGFMRTAGSAYSAPSGAVSMDHNTVEVEVTPTTMGQPASVKLLPPSAYLHELFTVRTGKRTTWWGYAAPFKRGVRVLVRGRIQAGIGPRRRFFRVLHPARYAGESFKRMLEDEGIKVGPAKRGLLPATPPPELHRHESAELSELLRRMNRHSNNFYAEQLVKALGAKESNPPGSTKKGLKALRSTLEWVGAGRWSYALANGSGLGGNTKLSARLLVRLLDKIGKAPALHKVIYDSLARPAEPGTLKRLKNTIAIGRMRAKTGTIKQVSCLAGYVDGKPGKKPLIFAIVHNGFTASILKIRDQQTKIVEALVRYSFNR